MNINYKKLTRFFFDSVFMNTNPHVGSKKGKEGKDSYLLWRDLNMSRGLN